MILLMCCTQYASKFGKLSSGHRTGKAQLSFQSLRRAMPKNVQTTTQLHSFHMLAKKCSKSFKLDYNSTWTKNFQMHKLYLQKAEEPDQIANICWFIEKKQGNSRKKKSASASLTMPKPLTVWITEKYGKFLKTWE